MLTVSDTAYAIATVRSRESELPSAERLFEDPYAGIFAAAGAHAEEGTARLLALEFMADGVRLRTRFVDDCVRDALASGTKQVVLLGAGFDARALRMPEIVEGGVRVFEVDMAPLLARKRELLLAAGVAPGEHVAHVACDFAEPEFGAGLRERLEAAGFRTGERAVVVWEGVIGYLDDASIERSLAFMANVCGSGSCVVFDYSDYRFGALPAAERVRRAGFTGFESTGLVELSRRYLRGEPHAGASAVAMGVARK